ncbi:hypothetical protein HKCCSP123_11235 [Rhodobacterales bacterium HKCCSP123]|nr:hypothetical protein [Rhodobacterales bacterium HKCCSP123]
MTDEDDNMRRSSIGDIVLWLSLAALVAIVIIGVATIAMLYPDLDTGVWSQSRALPPPRVFN